MGLAIDLHGVSGKRCEVWSKRKLALAAGKTVVRVATCECDTCHLLSWFIC